MRINARLDEEDSAKVKFLTRKTGMTLSLLVKDAIRSLYERHAVSLVDSLSQLEKTGFIACARGNQTLSQDYKKILHASLEKKHGHR